MTLTLAQSRGKTHHASSAHENVLPDIFSDREILTLRSVRMPQATPVRHGNALKIVPMK